MPSVSIVIPTHDTRELTLRCLASLLQAGAAPARIVVVDDGSSDGTAEALAARFPAVCILRNSTAQGFTRAANRGISASDGDLILLLNSDTEVGEEGLRGLAGAFTRRSDLGIGGAVLVYPDGRPQWNGGPAPTLPWLLALGSGLPRLLGRVRRYRALRPAGRVGSVDWVTGAALALRRAVWDEVGPFDTRFRFYSQDLDLCVRAGRAGWAVVVLEDFRVVHHHGATIRRQSAGGQLAESPELLWADLLRWWEKDRGRRASRIAAAALLLGGFCRLSVRALIGIHLRGRRRADWRRVSAAYRRAAAAVWRSAVGADRPYPD